MNIKEWLSDNMPVRRRRASDWILPALAGLGVGIAAGVGIGLLYAPSTGEEARLRLRERASRVKDRAADLAARARSQIASEPAPNALGRS
jgi:gas vesicle protein